MKVVICCLGMILASSAMAAKNCKLRSTVYSGGYPSCTLYSTKVIAANAEQCRQLAESTRSERFFGKLDANERVLRTRYVFKEAGQTVKDQVVFEGCEALCD